MFAPRYFANRYFPQRYFPNDGDVLAGPIHSTASIVEEPISRSAIVDNIVLQPSIDQQIVTQSLIK